MNNMRRGFTMIELVFVIVIIGILAAVALPRFTGIADDAHVSKLESFVGTMNRTVAPSIWSGIQRNVPGASGSVTHADSVAIDKYSIIFDPATTANTAADSQVESIPSELYLTAPAATGIHDIPLTACLVATTVIDDSIAGTGTIASADIANTTYNIGCIDGSLSASPHFFLDDGVRIIKK